MKDTSFLNLAREAALIELSLITGKRVLLKDVLSSLRLESVDGECVLKTQSFLFYFLSLDRSLE